MPFEYLKPDASDPKGKRVLKVSPSYEFHGMSVEIKIIVLKDNTISGTYRYFYVPCSEEDGGCEIISFGDQFTPLRYKYGNNQTQSINDRNSDSDRKTTRGERMDQAMANFITDKVIPSMLAEMRGETYYPQENPIPKASTAYTETTQGRQRQNPNSNIDPEITSQEQNAPISEQRASTPPAKVISSKNSYYIAQSVSNLISQELKEQEAKSKKPKGGETDEERLRNLKQKASATVNQFIISSLTSVGSSPEDSTTEVIIFNAGNSKPPREDLSLLCFVDGKCVGVGSSIKGIFTSFPKEQFGSGFHTLSLRGCAYGGYVELFSSKVDFSIKNNFLFDWKGGSIKLAN
jgi:hypothetical protein